MSSFPALRAWCVVPLLFLAGCGGDGRAPEGQSAVLELSAATLSQLRERFDAAGDRPRLLVLLSPT